MLRSASTAKKDWLTILETIGIPNWQARCKGVDPN